MSIQSGQSGLIATADTDPSLTLSKNESFAVDQATNPHDPSITFEEFLYWAKITRQDEHAANLAYIKARGPQTFKSTIKARFSKGNTEIVADASSPVASGNDDDIVTGVSAQEWKQASRSLRTAGWGAVFYLITTDVLGPFSTPWAFAQMGYGPGAVLYTVFGCMAGYSGWIMWKSYLGLDSDKFPMRTYGDLFFRVYGQIPRHIVNFMLGLQMLLFVAVLILANGQSISQISQGNHGSNGNGICFVACLMMFMAAGFILGQIRTLQRFAWISNFAVWTNLMIIFLCMGVVAHSPPNFKATKASYGDAFGPGPIKTFAGTPPAGYASAGTGLIGSLNGLDQIVYSYGGCMVFVSFLSEMRQPMDFWKALLCGELFIYCVYMFFGMFVYSFQGQFAYNPVMQGLSPYGFQTAANIMSIVTGLIAAALYGNIGFKVIYIEVLQELLHFPPLTQKKGKITWIVSIPIYWAIAFLVAAGIPQFSFVSGLIGAFFILSFTYTFPSILAMGYWIRKDAMLPEERFDPKTRTYNYVDSGFVRWKRGFMKKPLFNLINFVYMLGGITTTGLGVYSAIDGLIGAFSGKSSATSFGCTSPV